MLHFWLRICCSPTSQLCCEAPEILWWKAGGKREKISSSVLDSSSVERPLPLPGVHWGFLVPEQVVWFCFSFQVFGFCFNLQFQAWRQRVQGGRAGVELSSALLTALCRHSPGDLSAWKSPSFASAPGKFRGSWLCEVQWLTLAQMMVSCAVTVRGEMCGTKTVPQFCPSPAFSTWPVSLIPYSTRSVLASLIGRSGLFSLQVPLIIGLLFQSICAVGTQLLQWKYYFPL